MSETDFLKLKKHDNVETNTEKFDIENYLNGNWDKINENAKKVNTDISNINSKNKEQDTNIGQLQENTETSSNKIAELEKELKEAQEDFYQNSIRGQANGEYIHVEDSSNCRSIIGIGGNHEQETREGYNLLDLTSLIGKTETKNGVTYKINEDCSITVNGTPTDYTSFNLLDMSLKAGTYKFVDELDNINNVFLQTIRDFQHTSQNNTFSLAEDGKATVYLVILVDAPTLNNATLYPMIYEGTEDKPYEQYGVSPSPDYQSPVKTVGSNVNLLENTLKSQIINGIDVKVQDNGEIVLNGTATDNFILVIGKINKIKNMTFSGMCDGYGYNKMILQIQGKDYNVNVVNSNQITLSDLDTEATVRLYIYKGTSVINAIIEPKIVEGTEVGEYSKFGQGSVKVIKYNKNIFKETYNRKDLTSAYFSIVKGEGFLEKDKTYVISFDTTNNGGIVYLGEYSFQHINTYTVKCDGTRKFFTAKAKEFGYVTDITVLKTRAVTTNAYNISNVMINEYENDTDIDYIQHEEQSYIMPVQKEMLQGDYFDYDNEEEVHMWGKYTFIGEEDYQKSQTYSNDEYLCAYIPTPVINNIKIDGKGLSSHFNRIGDFTTYQNEECVRTSGQLQIRVLVSRLTENSVEGLKAYLKSQYDAGTPVVVYYQLATPTRIKFTDEQKAVAKELNNARTYKNVTNITTDSKAILSLDYAKDQETQNQKMQNEIDEIKQLLSTTQTSALLLDNMQTDIESEVK